MEDTMKDEKMVKFETIAQKRVQNALHAIELIGNLANPSTIRRNIPSRSSTPWNRPSL